MKKTYPLEVSIFFKMHHQIPLFLALCLSVWWFQMPLEGLSSVKTLATFGIIYAKDLILQNSWWRLFASTDSPLIFLNINPCRPCWITVHDPIFQNHVSLPHALHASLKRSQCPSIVFFTFWTQVTHMTAVEILKRSINWKTSLFT